MAPWKSEPLRFQESIIAKYKCWFEHYAFKRPSEEWLRKDRRTEGPVYGKETA